MSTLELRDITKRFAGVDACAGVNLRVEDGEFVTLLGPSGCGKSTTLNIVAGLETATAGDILMDGVRVNDRTPFERDVAMVFQQYALYPHMSVADNIGFSLRLQKRPKADIRERVGDVARLLELEPFLDRLPRQLSGGQQQRVALGRAVIRQPKVFLFDEPFSNLDAALRLRMREEIQLLHRRLGATSLFVTHDQEEAMAISDRIAVMRAGRVEQVGSPAEVYGRPVSRDVARFIGSPPMALLEGRLEPGADEAVYKVGAAAFPVPAAVAAALAKVPDATLGVRAEHVRFGGEGVAAAATVVQPLGPVTHVSASWDGGAVIGSVPGMALQRPGDPVRLSLDPAGMLFFDRATGARIPTEG